MYLRSKKLLFIYRTVLFNKVTFQTDDDLKTISNALNIKDKSKRYSYIYNEAIKEINRYYKDDFCKFKNNQCIAQRKSGKNKINGCCRQCPIVTDKGCPSENVACKLIYCKTALNNFKPLKLRNIQILKCLPITKRFIAISDFFQTKEQVIKDLSSNSFIYCIKTVIRNIKNEVN